MVNATDRRRNDLVKKEWLFKILLKCVSFNRCTGCGCKLPGRRCYLTDKLNGMELTSMKEILKKMKGGAGK